MHVILLFTYGYSLKLWYESGALEREVIYYKRLTNEGNIKFTFVTFGEEDDLDYSNEFDIFPIYKYLKKRKSRALSYLQSFYIPFIIKKNIIDFDVIKQNQLNGSWISILLKILTGKPLFIRTGYDMYKFSIEDNKKWFVRFLYKKLTSLSLRYSDLYSVSNSQDEYFLNKNFTIENKLIIRPNWVLSAESSSIDSRNKNSILNVGRLERQKNQIELIRALENTDFNLVIYGEGSLRNYLLQKSNELNVNTTINNVVQYKDLLEIYKQYKFFVLSSDFEGNPKVLLEAMASGCVVVAKNIPNNEELIENNQDGFIYSNEKELKLLFKNFALGNIDFFSISNKARKKVENNHSIEKLLKDEIKDLKNLIN
tara:strand:+ start:3057 stop:4163 length:1107 start_codon:yes stop_codon:yes gene_type:complete